MWELNPEHFGNGYYNTFTQYCIIFYCSDLIPLIKLVGLHNTYQFDLFLPIHQRELIAYVLEITDDLNEEILGNNFSTEMRIILVSLYSFILRATESPIKSLSLIIQ